MDLVFMFKKFSSPKLKILVQYNMPVGNGTKFMQIFKLYKAVNLELDDLKMMESCLEYI